MKAMDGVEEEEGSDALVKVLTAPAEVVQQGALAEQFVQGQAGAGAFKRLVADVRLCRRDDANEIWHTHFIPRLANSSTRPLSTSSRSCPSSAKAIWAVSNPYLTPMS